MGVVNARESLGGLIMTFDDGHDCRPRLHYKETYSDEVRDKGIMHLYQVRPYSTIISKCTDPVLVLAVSPERAVGQATCGRPNVDERKSEVKQIPFRIQGWGIQEF